MVIVYIVLFIYGSFFIFHSLTKSYLNPYKLIMVFGKKGSGKTTYLTKEAIKSIKKGVTVYSTVDIPGTLKFDVQNIGQYTFPPGSLVLIDEVGMIWDNRDFKHFRSDVRDFFKLQRQYKVKCILFSQTFDIDLKLRNLTDEMYLLTNFARVFSICRRITKKITIGHTIEGNGNLIDDYQFAPIFSHGWLKITFIPRYVRFFNSYDPKPLPDINASQMALNEVQSRYMSTKLWLWDTLYFSARGLGKWFFGLPKKLFDKSKCRRSRTKKH